MYPVMNLSTYAMTQNKLNEEIKAVALTQMVSPRNA